MGRMTKSLLVGLVGIGLLGQQVFAVGSGGYTNQAAGAKAFGQGNAFAARSDDASASTFNPAGLTQLNANELSLGLTLQTPFISYQTTAGEKDRAKNLSFTIPNFYLALKPGQQKWVVGLGVTSPFGLGTEWRDTSPLRYVATRSDLNLVNINPNFAYQINSDLSVGVGVDYFNSYRIRMEKQLSVGLLNYAISGDLADLHNIAKGQSSLIGRGDGWGYNLGLLYRTCESHSLGLTFRSPVKVKYEGDVKMSGLGYSGPTGTDMTGYSSREIFGGKDYSDKVSSEFTYPAVATLGYAIKASDSWLWELDVEWTGWAAFQEMQINYAETDPYRLAILNSGNPTPKEWKNVFSAALGTEYILANNLALRSGYSFWDTPVPTKTFEPSTPDSDVHGLALGFGYPWDDFSIDFGYQFLYFTRRTVENTVGAYIDPSTGTQINPVNGKYLVSNSSYALNFNYKF
ncbi:MAG: outer membrane protein transport protein [Elusimicrobiota bacterium]